MKMCYNKNRKSLFGSVLNTIHLNNNKNDWKRKPEKSQLVKVFWTKSSNKWSFRKWKSFYKCCNRNHISIFKKLNILNIISKLIIKLIIFKKKCKFANKHFWNYIKFKNQDFAEKFMKIENKIKIWEAIMNIDIILFL